MASSKIIDVVLRMKDQMTGPLGRATSKLEESARQYQRMGNKMIRTGKKISSAGATLTKTITAPVVALGAVAYKEFGEYDKSMRLVQQTMGSTDEESKMLGESIKEAAKNSVYGMQDAADASLNYARAGYNAKQTADMISPAFNLAAGTGTELATVTDGLATALKSFRADSEEATEYADVFAKAQAQSKTTVEDLFEATAKAAAVFTTAKWSIKDLAVATGILGDEGIKGAEAGTALKSGFANLTPHSKSAKLWFEKMGISVTNADGSYKSFLDTQKLLHGAFQKLTPEEKTNAAVAIFGKHQYVKWLKIIERSPEEVQKLSDALGNAKGQSGEMADALMSGPGGAIETLKSNWDIFKNTLGETIAPILTPIVEKLTDLVQAFGELSDEQKLNIVKWVGIAAAAGPVLVIVGKLVTGVGKLVKWAGKLGTAMKKGEGIFKAFKGAPKGAVIGALGAIGTAVTLLIKNWDEITAKISGFYDKVKPGLGKIMSLFNKVFGFIEDLLSGPFMQTFNTVLNAIESVVTVLGGVAEFIEGVFTLNWEKIWNGLKNIVIGAFKGIANFVIGVINTVIHGLNVLIGGFNKTKGFLGDAFMPSYVNAASQAAGYKSTGDMFNSAGNLSEIPTIPTFATGTRNWKGGLVQISEKGGEIVDLPKGSRVYPHDESVKKAYQAGAGHNVSINIPKLADTITVREDADIDKIATKLAAKLEKVSQNMGGGQISYANQS